MQYLKQLSDVISELSCLNINYSPLEEVIDEGYTNKDVAKILSHDIKEECIYYEVKWKNGTITIESEEMLKKCSDSILNYWNIGKQQQPGKVIIYCRVSSKGQDNIQKGHISMDTQEYCCRLHTTKARVPICTVVKEVQSARNINQQKKLMTIIDCLNEKDLLLIWNVTRFSRDPLGGLKIVDNIQAKKASIYFIEEDILIRPTSVPVIIHKFRELLSQSRLESDVISWRSKGHKKIQSIRGSYMGGIAPYGYNIHKDTTKKIKKLLPNKDEQFVIKFIHDTAKDNKKKRKYSEIANQLNEKNKKYRTKTWTATNVRYIHKKDYSKYQTFMETI
jgi:DNA invertase Pin-like site-specific DNA recombinase